MKVSPRLSAARQRAPFHGLACGSWLCAQAIGIGEPEPTEQPAKPTAPPVKSFRGPVKLSKAEPAPVADDDILSRLAELENG
jgi:hypothetical protein